MTAPTEPGPISHYRQVNGIRLHCMEAGPADGTAVLLLHGFPEFWFSWRQQIPALAAAGFHVIAPDLRGYNLSDKPKRIRDYRVEAVTGDVLALIDSLPSRRAAVVGHDWGGVIAWAAAMWGGSQVEKLAVLNAPHPLAYLRELRRSSQLLRSWYTLFFQLPWLPEAVIRRDDYAMARRLYRQGPARLSLNPDEDIETYIRALAQPGALMSAINFYRAAMRGGVPSLVRSPRPITIPTLLIWGDRDPYLVRSLTEGLAKWVTDLRVHHLPQATHWVQHDDPVRVNELLLGFLCSKEDRPRGACRD